MKRTLEIESNTSKSGKKAIRYFFRRHPELNYWKETFEYMLNNNINFYCDNTYGDGTRNNDWTYALHLDINEDNTYICIIERS